MANYCQGICRLCGAACEEYIIEARRLRKEMAEMHTIACEKDTEIASLDVALKGESEEVGRLSAANFELQAQVNRLRAEVERLETNYVHTCHAECQKPLCVANREVERLRAENARLKAAGSYERHLLGENAQLRTALTAIAAKGPASPGDKKARMAKDALEGAPACHTPEKRV